MKNKYVYVFLHKPLNHHLLNQKDYGLGGTLIKKDIISVEIEQQDGTVWEIPTNNIVAIEKHREPESGFSLGINYFIETLKDRLREALDG